MFPDFITTAPACDRPEAPFASFSAPWRLCAKKDLVFSSFSTHPLAKTAKNQSRRKMFPTGFGLKLSSVYLSAAAHIPSTAASTIIHNHPHLPEFCLKANYHIMELSLP
ncbi:MAG: hypothetical protein PF495_08020 [Spirochaetales bacterium]|jgi:hypothetical protein|nr:hypothetical protein [Spirochaetales bacterium]